MDMKNFYENQVEHYRWQLKHDNDQIEWLNNTIKRCRKEDREYVERVWAKGVVDEFEMKVCTPSYEGFEVKSFKKDRAYYYKQRAKHKRILDMFERKLLKEA